MRTLLAMKRAVIAALAACALAGCGGNAYHRWYPPGSNTDCTPPTNTVLVYPSNNATGVPDNTMTVYVAVPTALSTPANFDVNLIGPPSYGSQLTYGFTAVTYSSIPTPNTVPTYSNPQYYATTLRNTLTAATAFGVYWNQLNNGCNSSTSASLIGSFTTQ